jgi:hypothetical protein
LVPHETGTNKSDPKLGVTALAPHWRYGRVRLPGKGAGRAKSLKLVDEVTKWPMGRTDDTVMAEWMFEWNRPRLAVRNSAMPLIGDAPAWLAKSP